MCSSCDPDEPDPPFLTAMGNFFKLLLSSASADEYRITQDEYDREDRIWL